MHSYRNLNTVFYAVSCGNELYKVISRRHTCVTFSMEKRENSLTGNENDKFIESYIAQPPLK